MNSVSARDHWQSVYQQKSSDEVSWFQTTPSPSLELLHDIGINQDTSIIDIGGGSSCLVDHLLAAGIERITVLDISEAALEASQKRIGNDARRVEWIVADVTRWTPATAFDIWHDRAALHFLTKPDDICAYIERLKSSLKPGGHAIIGTFALDGPEYCSGLPVMRYDSSLLQKQLGLEFELVASKHHKHLTPGQFEQSFQFNVFRFNPDAR
jgi:2-polyprenyl-3-methyl-5-hydroxy-6-metoxy-1,4-benzoquinol methylase